MRELLKKIYDPEEFRKTGHALVDILADYLADSRDSNIPVMDWKEPEEQLEQWKKVSNDDISPDSLFKKVIADAIHIHQPNYMGHQVCPPAPTGALAEFLGALLNNGMAIYEMGPSATAIEKISVDLMCEKVGYGHDSDGFLTSGGTLANVTGLLAARQWFMAHNPEIPFSKMAVMLSSEAHYSVERALRIMGFSESGIIKVPVTDSYKIDTSALERIYQKAVDDGTVIIALAGNAPSTSTGIYDDLEALACFCVKKNIWFHVDAAHGGGAVFSEKYKHLLNGIDHADSVVIDAHKMMMTPALTTFLLFKNRQSSYVTFSQKAEYLMKKANADEWHNSAQRTMECTKIMLGLRFWTILKLHGEEAFEAYVTTLYDLGREMADEIKKRDKFELAVYPDSNIVCFRLNDGKQDEDKLDMQTDNIRRSILEKGDFYVVQTNVGGSKYLRVTLMNPLTNIANVRALLDDIEVFYSGI